MRNLKQVREPHLKLSVLNANHPAYGRLSGLIGFRRPAELYLYRPRLFSERPALARPVGDPAGEGSHD